ncbi:Rop guanine nucleotide exchange factor 3 [Linum perenne]
MENSSSMSYDGSYDLDQTTMTPGYSTMSGDSASIFGRTYSETSATENNSCYSSSEPPSPCHWPPPEEESKSTKPRRSYQMNRALLAKQDMMPKTHNLDADADVGDQDSTDIELEMMKERFSKLLLGEDMSGNGKGVCTAVTISNSITNLYATVFGQNLRLEPLKPEKKGMWRREMDCLLSVCDYIVELIPKSQNLRDVMESRVRSDIYMNLPALRKLDAMLIVRNPKQKEQGSMSSNSTRSGSFRRVVIHRTEEKWWVPVPCVPSGGISEKSRKHLRDKRDCANQIHKAAMAINTSILTDMEIPDSYMDSLPRSGKTSVGETIYKYMSTIDKFSPERLLNCLNIESEHEALELADRVEASMYTWRRKACLNNSRSSWGDLDRIDKNHVLAQRAESLLFCLKQRYPGLSQTSLDICKIQCNRDVGQAILESYSRVLEGLAFNIVAWIEDVLFVDKSVKSQQ